MDYNDKNTVKYYAEKLKVPYEDLVFVSEQPKNAVILRQLCTKEIKETLKKEYQPVRLFLFGSRANGTAKRHSDYDFVMVVSNPKKSSLNEMEKARELVHRKHKVSADIFIYSEKEFDDWKDEFSSIPETALNTGKELEL
jgi:predicted nucleotidyltransferase